MEPADMYITIARNPVPDDVPVTLVVQKARNQKQAGNTFAVQFPRNFQIKDDTMTAQDLFNKALEINLYVPSADRSSQPVEGLYENVGGRQFEVYSTFYMCAALNKMLYANMCTESEMDAARDEISDFINKLRGVSFDPIVKSRSLYATIYHILGGQFPPSLAWKLIEGIYCDWANRPANADELIKRADELKLAAGK